MNVFRLIEGDSVLRGVCVTPPAPPAAGAEFTEHCWLAADRLAVASMAGEVSVFEKQAQARTEGALYSRLFCVWEWRRAKVFEKQAQAAAKKRFAQLGEAEQSASLS